MKNIMKISLLLTFALLLMVGCGNNDTKKNNNNNDGNNSENESSTNSNDGDQVLQLGETGTMDTTIGKYEVTPLSFVATDDWNGEKPKIDGDIFVVIDVKIKNVGDSVLSGEDIREVDGVGGEDTVVPSSALYGYIKNLEGEMQPGEEIEGQIAFAFPPADTYELIFGLHKGTVSNKITWELPADQAE